MKFPPYGYSVLPPPWAVFVYARKHSERPALLKLSWSWESVTGGVRRSFGKVTVEASSLFTVPLVFIESKLVVRPRWGKL